MDTALAYGHVVLDVREVLNGPGGGLDAPDEVLLSGSVQFTPSVDRITLDDVLYVVSPVTVDVVGGELVDTTLIATTQEGGFPDSFFWHALLRVKTTRSEKTFMLGSFHLLSGETIDLSTVSSVSPEPGVVWVMVDPNSKADQSALEGETQARIDNDNALGERIDNGWPVPAGLYVSGKGLVAKAGGGGANTLQVALHYFGRSHLIDGVMMAGGNKTNAVFRVVAYEAVGRTVGSLLFTVDVTTHSATTVRVSSASLPEPVQLPDRVFLGGYWLAGGGSFTGTDPAYSEMPVLTGDMVGQVLDLAVPARSQTWGSNLPNSTPPANGSALTTPASGSPPKVYVHVIG